MIKQCPVCSKEFKTYFKKQKTCSKTCMGINNRGENNPNFGNHWSEDKKLNLSNLIKSKYANDNEYRHAVGRSNRGVKFDQARIQKMHKHRDSSSYSHPHTDESKQLIGKKSKEKFTEEYRIKVRKTLVKNGRAVPDSQKTDFVIYKIHSEWIHRMWDLVDDQTLLKTVGIFNSFTNLGGCERDHKFSRMDGFINGVFPEILRHPANCQLLTHSDNSSKREKSCITKEELFREIRCYNKHWQEQEIVLNLINRYESGERFIVDNYRRE